MKGGCAIEGSSSDWFGLGVAEGGRIQCKLVNVGE